MEKEFFKKFEGIESQFEKEFFPNLKIISGLESRSGNEHLVRQFLIEKATELNIENETDEIGNLYFKSDKPEGDIMLCAHMDKVGEAKQAVLSGDTVTGRLDDTLGINIILETIKKGFRPSVLFTTQEENGFYGSEFAVKRILSGGIKKPSLILVLDVSALLKHKEGPIIYTSSGGIDFPLKTIELLKKIIKESKQKVNFIPGFINDSAVLSKLPDQNIATLQVHVDNMHTSKETAAISDIESSMKVLEIILKNNQEFAKI